jgi:hypothetical protein
MMFVRASTWENHVPRITKHQLPFLIAEEIWQLFTIKHLGNDAVRYGILPSTTPARQLAKGLLQYSRRQMEVKRGKKKRL